LRFHGYIGEKGRPFLTIYTRFPFIHAQGDVDFLIDTGSDSTTLNTADAKSIGIDLKKLTYLGTASGVGETARLGIGSQGTLWFFDATGNSRREVLPKNEVLNNVDYSLLGRDIMTKFKLYFDNTTVYLDE
jgi:hypothetical protein